MVLPTSNHQRQPLFIVATYITVIITSLLAYGYKLTSSNIYNQVPAIIALLNPDLYNNDFYIQEMTQFTPRYYYYHLIYLGVKLGVSLPWVCFGLYIIAFSSFLIGLYSVGKLFNQSKLSATVFTFLGFAATINGRIGHADLFRSDPIPATLAMGLVIWGFYFCFKQKWILAYLFFGLTCLMQFLVGALPGILMAVSLLISARKNKNFQQIFWAFSVLGICVSLIYVPMLLSGNTSSGTISNEEFVYLYGYIRHPHHIIFSAFGLKGSRGWLNFILFTIGGLFCIKSSKSLNKDVKFQLFSIIFISCFLLLINYIFVEIYPLDFIAKLQFARTTPFAQLMILIGISVLAEEQYNKGNLPIVFLLIIAPILRGAGILLLILGVSLWLRTREKEGSSYPSDVVIFSWGLISICFLAIYYELYFLIALFIVIIFVVAWYNKTKNIRKILGIFGLKLFFICVLFLLMPIKFFPDGIIVDLFFILWWGAKSNKFIAKKLQIISIFLFIVFMILYKHYDLFLLFAIALPLLIDKFIYNSKRQRLVIFSLATIFLTYFSLNLLKILPSQLSSFFESRIRIDFVSDNDIAILAQEFQKLSLKNTLVLVPPLDEKFRFYSQSSVVFTFKSFPFTDQGINIWTNRLYTFAKTQNFNKHSLDTFYQNHSNSEIIAIAKKFGANYILTRIDWHPNLDGSVIFQQGDWIIYQINMKSS